MSKTTAETTDINTNEAKYTVSELAAAADKVLGRPVAPECVVAALKIAGKTEVTIQEAKDLVNKFLKKEVR